MALGLDRDEVAVQKPTVRDVHRLDVSETV